MPVSLPFADSRTSASINAQVEQAVGIARKEAERLRGELERLAQENLSLRMEVAHLTQDNEDLRESAKLWLRLYEGHLDRADRAVSSLRPLPG